MDLVESLALVESMDDPDYDISDMSLNSDNSFVESQQDSDSWKEKKCVVFENQLNTLLQMVSCPECCAKVDPEDITTTQTGSLVSVRFVCLNSHQFEWKSQPLFGRQPAGNVFLAASTLFTGSTFEHLSSLSQCLNLQVLGRTCFYDIQHKHLFPGILNERSSCRNCNKQKFSAWHLEREKQLQKLQQAEQCNIILIGDGRLDSPGWNAKYMVYTLMCKESTEIIDFQLVQVTETGTSPSMEKEGCKRGLDYLTDNNIKVEKLGTDRHTGIQSMLKQSPYSSIVKFHESDPWHIIKGVEKKEQRRRKRPLE